LAGVADGQENYFKMNKLFLPAALMSAACILAADKPQAGGAAVVAEIDGVKVTRAEFERSNQARLFQPRNTYFEAERKALDEYATDYLLERQARKESLTVAQLLDRHVNSKIAKDPSDEALRVYYEGVNTTEPFESVKVKIIESLRQNRIAKAKAAYIQSLRADAKVVMHLDAPRAEVSVKDAPVRGPKNPKVLIIEYADYECPYCQQIQPALDKLEADFKGKLALAYKDVPLPMHAHAAKAAEASHCAAAQGKYWEYHDVLSATKQLELPQLKDHARGMGLNSAAFDKCLDSGEKAQIVQDYVTEATALGLQGTPSFFINGRFISGIQTYEKLREIVEEELGAPMERQKTASR
jgi:protein-disulfide isomerase